MSRDAILGRVLMDPTTGLPNLPYFRLIRDWEERRGARRNYRVSVLKVDITGGDERLRRSLPWRLCRELRDSDLVASRDVTHYRVLLTTPDAERAGAIADRLRAATEELNNTLAGEQRLAVSLELDERPARDATGPCEICPDDALEDSREGRRFQNDD